MAFVRNVEFDRVGVFTYSDEEGTPAFELPDKVDARTAKRRRDASDERAGAHFRTSQPGTHRLRPCACFLKASQKRRTCSGRGAWRRRPPT